MISPMRSRALFAALLALVVAVLFPQLTAQIEKFGEKRAKPPKGWHKFEWPKKREVLFKHFGPTPAEKDLIAKNVPKKARAVPQKDRRVLVYYRCDYPHTSIATGCEAFEQMAKASGAFSVDLSAEPSVFTPENLAKYDGILLNNTVNFDTHLNDAQRQALLDFVKGGKGLIGIHAASDSCKKWRDGAKMIGGVFRCHPWTARGEWATKLETPDHNLNKAWGGKAPWVRDEIYMYRDNTFKRERSRVLLSLDMGQGRNWDGEFIRQNDKRIMDRKKGDYPVAWLHEYGKGRVFYSNLGHNNFTFWNATVLQHYLDGIQYALGDLSADATPSAKIAPADLKIVSAESKKVIFLAGRPSHQSGDHEFRAGSLLLAKRLNEQIALKINAEVITGWPQDESVLDGASAIVIYCDSDSIHRKHYPKLRALNDAGTGLFFMHYGVHPADSKNGRDHYLPTVGGFFANDYSVNPQWAAKLEVASDHPVRRGVEKPFEVFDEFYYHLQFADGAEPLVTAVPTNKNLIRTNLWNENGENGLDKSQTLMWGFTNKDGTRGGGFTGGHYHRNWADDRYRKVVLNAIVWTAGLEVPPKGVKSSRVTEEEINANLDQKKTMRKIDLPLKSAKKYRQEMLDGRKKRNEERQKKKAAAAKNAAPKAKAEPVKVFEKPNRNSIDSILAKGGEWEPLLDEKLSQWDVWMGVPHKTVTGPGITHQPDSDGKNGTPLGLNNDPLGVFSVVPVDGEPVLRITGQVFGGLTTKKEYENYHLSLHFKWGEKKWAPRLEGKRDSGLLLHCVGKHGAFWNVWKRCLECQVQEGDCGDFFALAGTGADIPVTFEEGKWGQQYDPKADRHFVTGRGIHNLMNEKPNGQWNLIEVKTVGDHMAFYVNGKKNMELFNTREKAGNDTWKPLTKGQIQIQSEAAEVYYKDIKIRPIAQMN